MPTNYATIEHKTLNRVEVKAGHVDIVLHANNSNYMDILEQIAKMMCEMHPIALLDKLKNA